MEGIAFRTIGIAEIGIIAPLWAELNEYHRERSRYFRHWYETTTFSDRRAHFERVAREGPFRLELAFDGLRCVGYCAGSISPERMGEIESLFITGPYRSRGIGSELVRRILAWLDDGGAIRKRVSVGDGNEAAWEFYRKFGFCPRLTVLEQVPEGNTPCHSLSSRTAKGE